MTLSLPEDLTALATDDVNPFESAGVYLLELSKPENPAEAWDSVYDVRPEWFDSWRDSSRVLYVGASKCVLSRLEDHRNSEVRLTALTRVCSVESLENVFWYEDADEAFLRESQHALEVDQRTGEETFVHSN